MGKKKIAILGSTGSIGTQALQIIKSHSDKFEAEVLTAHKNADLLIKQAIEFSPNEVVIADESQYLKVKEALSNTFIKVYAGREALIQVVQNNEIDIVLGALVGFSGVEPVLEAVKNKKIVALANKESLVVAGSIIMKEAVKNNVPILPVDSEHSAIFQCLVGEGFNKVEKIYLTASGGPFRGKKAEELENVTVKQALNHPNWDMGAKVTIDSASMLNKGLEIIEAKWLFNLPPEKIDVLVHSQSIIHSMVEFEDRSIKAQLGLPDMRVPIQFAFSYPERIKADFPGMNPTDFTSFTFEQPDKETFRNLQLAYDALEKGGNMPCVLNAANEIAVQAFLEEKIGFMSIPKIIEKTMEKASFRLENTLADYLASDGEARDIAKTFIKK